ncbi:hypothetical protein KAW53_02340 [Candidatus Bathyarchaeota archaeon]|nr:hypothetical protein [Candidatus Bathyarchaeota archaeon]
MREPPCWGLAKSWSPRRPASALEVLELICKPRRARHARPVDQKDWVGDLDKYRRFTI